MVTEDVQIQKYRTVFNNNIIDQEHGHPWITELKFKKPDLQILEEEYQKNVDYHWV